jgi:hypothetical protein
MLVLAASALTEVAASWFDPIIGRSQNTEHASPGESLLRFSDFRFYDFAWSNEGNKHHKTVHPADTFPTKGNILNGHRQLVTHSEAHLRKPTESRRQAKGLS